MPYRDNLAAADAARCGLSDGYSRFITEEIARLEYQLTSVRDRLRSSDPRVFKLQVRDTRRFVESRLRRLDALWDGDARIAREEIAKHVRKITLKPAVRTYVATGVWDWLGVLGSAAAMVVLGGPACTRRIIEFSLSLAA